MEINFEDWRKENPNGSLNDFYSTARKSNNPIVSYPSVEKVIVYEPVNIDNKQKLKVFNINMFNGIEQTEKAQNELCLFIFTHIIRRITIK